MTTRLVSFLGTGKYSPVIYRDSTTGRCASETRWIALALAELYNTNEILVLATREAEDRHAEGLRADLERAGFHPELRRIPTGGAASDLWQQFEVIKEALRAPEGTEVILDITHGFRSQPFFAAAVVAFIRAVDVRDVPLSVVYGGFEAKDDAGVAPVWELTPFIDLLDYAREIMLFLKTGRVNGVAQRAEALGRSLAREWAETQRQDGGSRPGLDRLARAISAFGQDLETIRTQSLLLGTDRKLGSAKALLDLIRAERPSLDNHLPPLADVLDRIEAMAKPLTRCDGRLNTPEGHAALTALAKQYLEMGRYSEAATTVREGVVTLYASDSAACPGKPGYDPDARGMAEKTWQVRDRDFGRQIAAPRNDIDHAGFRAQPLPAASLKEQIATLVDRFARAEPVPADPAPPVFVNLSNHPSTAWVQAQRDAALALAPEIVDIPFPPVPPDATADDIACLRDACLAEVPAGASHAMIQGEFTLAFALVQALQGRNIVCLAATTDRDVDETAAGELLRRFRFVGFRPYLIP